MPIDARIRDGAGGKRTASVDSTGAVSVAPRATPPYGGEQAMRVFRQFFTADGTSTGSNNMRVNGGTTNVEFWIPAHAERDRYICQMSFVLADASMTLAKFGNLTALSNGVQLLYTDKNGTVTIHGGVTTTFQLLRLCTNRVPIGSQSNAFIANNVSGTAEGIMPDLDLRQRFGFQWGLKLAAGTNQKLIIKIRDDLTGGLDQFDAIGYGFERLPE